MPVEICQKCGEKISFSKQDTLKKVHCCRKKFREEIVAKPVLNVEEKDADREQGEKDVDVETSHFNVRTGSGRPKKVQD